LVLTSSGSPDPDIIANAPSSATTNTADAPPINTIGKFDDLRRPRPRPPPVLAGVDAMGMVAAAGAAGAGPGSTSGTPAGWGAAGGAPAARATAGGSTVCAGGGIGGRGGLGLSSAFNCSSYSAFFFGSSRHSLAEDNSLRIFCDAAACWPDW